MAHIKEGRPDPGRPEERCPFCQAVVSRQAEVCPECGEELFEEPLPHRRPRPQRPPQDTGLEFVVPVNVSGWAGYLGLLSCFPLVGPLFAVPAIACSIKALPNNEKAVPWERSRAPCGPWSA